MSQAVAFEFTCPTPGCGHRYHVTTDLVGVTMQCKDCKQPFEVPNKPDDPPATNVTSYTPLRRELSALFETAAEEAARRGAIEPAPSDDNLPPLAADDAPAERAAGPNEDRPAQPQAAAAPAPNEEIVTCPLCHSPCRILPEWRGATLECPGCQRHFIVPRMTKKPRKPRPKLRATFIVEDPNEPVRVAPAHAPPPPGNSEAAADTATNHPSEPQRPMAKRVAAAPAPWPIAWLDRSPLHKKLFVLGGTTAVLVVAILYALWGRERGNAASSASSPSTPRLRVTTSHGASSSNDPDPINRALADVKLDDANWRAEALELLARIEPNERRTEVLAAIESRLDDVDLYARESAVKALVKWGGIDSSAQLLRALKDDAHGVREQAMIALARFGVEEAIEPIAGQLEEFVDRRTAGDALKTIGPKAEVAVLKFLKHPDPLVRREACGVLREIGTKTSLAELQRLASGRDSARIEADEAIRAIRSRR